MVTHRFSVQSLHDIREYAREIGAVVERLSGQLHFDRLDIVGHSMGGLAGLYYLKRLGGRRRIRRLVLLGSPVRGTWSALLGLAALPLGQAGRQLLPSSEFLRELQDAPMPSEVEVFSVMGDRDLLVPERTTRMRGVRRVRLSTNHTGLLLDEKTAKIVARLLDVAGHG